VQYLALKMIGLYQQHISAHKGYCCAYRFQTGRLSCSHFAARAIRRRGILTGLKLTLRRFRKCSDAHVAASDCVNRRIYPRHARYQTGNCDLSFDGCDLSPDNCTLDNCSPDMDDCGSSSCPSACDWRNSKRKTRSTDTPVSS